MHDGSDWSWKDSIFDDLIVVNNRRASGVCDGNGKNHCDLGTTVVWGRTVQSAGLYAVIL